MPVVVVRPVQVPVVVVRPVQVPVVVVRPVQVPVGNFGKSMATSTQQSFNTKYGVPERLFPNPLTFVEPALSSLRLVGS